MFLDNYPCTTSELCHSILFKGLASAPAILLIHDYMSTPHELKWLGKQLNDAGYTVYIPRLPGHGTKADDFLNCTRKDWVRRVFDAYIDIVAMHEKVFVGGYSMGALLAGLVAARFNPEKLLLFAPPLKTTNKRLRFTPFLKFFVKTVTDPQPTFFSDAKLNKALIDYIGVNYIPMQAEFYKLQKLAGKNLPLIKAETLILLAEKDTFVPLTVKDLLDAKIKAVKEYLLLRESGHDVIGGVEKEKVVKKVIEFLKG